MKAVINERFWVPATQELEERARTLYQFKSYDDRQCDRCELRPTRHCETCDACPAYLGETVLWIRKESSKGEWIGVPKGNRVKLKRFAGGDIQLEDRRGAARMIHPIQFTGTLREHQTPTVDAIIAAGRGVLLAPPRSGKTTMAVAVACRMRYKTLILAAQQEWLDEFYRTFMGNETLPAMTNAPEIAQFESAPVVGFCRTVEDFERHDVCLSTYQGFISKGGKARLRAVRSLFGLIIVDEVQGTSSTEFARVMLGLNARHVIGLTATPARKDLLYDKVTLDIIGPVKAKSVVETLIPTVKIVETPASTRHNYKLWTYAMRYLATHKERNELIVKHAVHYIRQGRSLVIPVTLVAHGEALAAAINKEYGENVAVSFTSRGLTKARRAEILQGARDYSIKCVVGIRSLVQVGINVPRWDTLFVICPISNVPKAMQETSRIRTVEPGKPPPRIVMFLENFGPSVGAFRTLYWQTFVKEGFTIPEKDRKLAMQYLNNKRKTPVLGGELV